jgi:16S rRNA (uracil1498-N3)-methyltransferase
MSERFFSSDPITSDRVTLVGPEAHHLLHVMRAGIGTPLTMFDDSGAEFAAIVETVGRSDAVVRIVERREIDRELAFPLVAGVALPKGDHQKWLVEKLTELGATELVPLVTDRGVAEPTGGAAERLRRTVIEASKQCGRNRLMRIAAPQTWNEWISQAADLSPPPRRLLAVPAGLPLSDIDLHQPLPTQIAIGPEGGFTDAEADAALASGWQPVSLGARTLRVETAAVALAAALTLSLGTKPIRDNR